MSTIDMGTVIVPDEIYEELVEDKKLLDFILYYYMDRATFDDTMIAWLKHNKRKDREDAEEQEP